MRILAIAVNTFREAVRDKVLYNLLFFALAIMLLSVTISNLTLGQRSKVILDVGLASLSLFGLLIAIFVGIQLVYKEIQRRTVYVLLAKPVARGEFILGKFLGLAAVIALNVAVMTATFLVILKVFAGVAPGPKLWVAVGLSLVELLLVTAVALFFSSFSTPTLSAMFTLGVWVIGQLSSDLKDLARVSELPALRRLTEILYLALPNLERFNLRTEAVYDLPVDPGMVLASLGYGAAWIGLLIVASALIFGARDFR